jgi:branched-chain amino acid transport system permease protein
VEYILHILVLAGIYSILALGLNLIVGFTGLPAFGHAAFFAVGAYISSILTVDLSLSPWLGLLLGACGAAILGIIVGFPSLRLKGDYFALVTFGLGLIVYSITKNWVSVTRGPFGIPGIPPYPLFNFTIDSVWAYLLLVIAIMALGTFVAQRIVSSPFGRILRSIREDEIASKALGKNTDKHKLLIFAIGAFFAGVAGSLFAHYITFIDPSSFTVLESITILLMVIFGGMGSISGSIIGASLLVLLPELLRFLGMPSSIAAPTRQMLYGLLLIVLMIKKPQGLMGTYIFK